MNPLERDVLMEISQPDEGVVRTLWAMPDDLLLLGAGGKIGHGLALMAKRAFDQTDKKNKVVAVSRFSDQAVREEMEADGIATIVADLSDPKAVAQLPDTSNLVYLAGQKFGTGDNAALTWMLNTIVPSIVAQRWASSRLVIFSSSNVYPFTSPDQDGPKEDHPTGPIGEYAQSVLGRERIFEYYARRLGTKVTTLRLNYANEPRYGVLVDLARKIMAHEPIDLTQGYINIIWQGDSNRVTLRSFEIAESPPKILNLAGPTIFAVRDLALRLGKALGIKPQFVGRPARNSLLISGEHCWELFGPPQLEVDQMVEKVAAYLKAGGQVMGKPTHFEVRDGRF